MISKLKDDKYVRIYFYICEHYCFDVIKIRSLKLLIDKGYIRFEDSNDLKTILQ